ncbi:hypothetical protein MMC11_005911 [Xylographa trunciseda]|nr:hypothetical protein [Xylographa trunciseda]
MPSDLSTTVPRRVTENAPLRSDPSAKPPHLRVLEEEPPLRAPAPAKPNRQAWTYPELSEQVAIQERAERATIAQNGLECPICQEGFRHDEAVIRIEGCRHAFHATECFQPWFETGTNSCPYCRGALTKLTPGTWQRGEGIVAGDFYLRQTASGHYLRCWNGNHPELWALGPRHQTASGEWRAMVRHRYEDLYDLVWDEPLETSAEPFGRIQRPTRLLVDEFDMQEAEDRERRSEAQDWEDQGLEEVIRATRYQLDVLGDVLHDLNPEQLPEAEPMYQLLRLNLEAYLDRVVNGRRV